MSSTGQIYGVVLNDIEELAGLALAFGNKPYSAPPRAPVVYMKPASAIARGPVSVDGSVSAAVTLALLFARDASRIADEALWDHVGASALAVDLSYPNTDYYRPDIDRRIADGFLALGGWGAPQLADTMTLSIDGDVAHGWTLARLARPVGQLVADLSAFMTLQAGDVLLVGLPGDAPRAQAGQTLIAQSHGFAPVSLTLEQAA